LGSIFDHYRKLKIRCSKEKCNDRVGILLNNEIMNLENLNVQEMNNKEMKDANGGFIYWWVRLYGGINFGNAFPYNISGEDMPKMA